MNEPFYFRSRKRSAFLRDRAEECHATYYPIRRRGWELEYTKYSKVWPQRVYTRGFVDQEEKAFEKV